MDYIELLAWLAVHPIESFLIVLLQFFGVMWVHNRFHNPILHWILAIWFLPQDCVVNTVLFTIIGLELPQEWTVTARMKRWQRVNLSSPLGIWRFTVADRVCRVLDKAELGHC